MIQPLKLNTCRRMALALSSALLGFAMLAFPAAVAASAAESANRTSYVLFAEGDRSTSMSGNTEDLRRARALRVGTEALLYVRDGSGAYVIRDPATVRQARAVFEPQEKLGAQQAELGSRQAALGGRQAALGAQQAQLGAQQAAAPRRAVALSGQIHELGRQQAALGQQQAELGRQQSALGQQQQRLAREAHAKIRALLADALRRGLAQRVN